MKKKQKILLLVSVLAVLMSAGGYVTYSYLSTVTKTANNTFQSDKKIGITLTEPEWDDHGKTEALSYVPGQIIDKDPAVILDDDSVSSYVALKVQYFNEDGEEITFGEFQEAYLDGDSESQGLDFSDSWVYIGNDKTDEQLRTGEYGKSVLYMYKTVLKPDDSLTDISENVTESLFTKVHLSDDISQDEYTRRLPHFNINVTAYAVQSDGIGMEEAKKALNELAKADGL